MKKVFLSQNIVGANYIVCTHWLNIVGAAAPIAPMVPTPMVLVNGGSPVATANNMWEGGVTSVLECA